ncbi:glycyl-tRNA synthetase [Staphylothermus marinus F1]|uniref:glycine--tRNA ligase n=1 Tax=Staphylothermus marinus (strain ATCC 43588 / DSM 3639 / JCM 9404 / F1) TaxID=399550 RepID=A3DNL9_STAMF|nr:glycine--tRNA ligase [Staphylothermus marinus]ABN70229.1 glycyl-tRNA synthetase [Staphylothermus marinus F1]
MVNKQVDKYQILLDLGKRRGLFWLSYEIYGGVAGFYDFGPNGVLIKRNIINEWLNNLVYNTGLVLEIETPIITPRIVLKASGHEDHFTDPITECTRCGRVFRADHLIEEALGIRAEGLSMDELWKLIKEHNIRCPECGGELTKPKPALLLFKTEIGPYKGSPAYLRPETAQGMFVSFKHVLNIARNKLPLGIAQIGRVGRNEISPRQGLLRLREFTIMELEFFFDPEKAFEETMKYMTDEIRNEKLNIITAEDKLRGEEKTRKYTAIELIENKIVKNPWMAYWMALGNIFLRKLGISSEKIRFDEKLPEEKAHYSEQTFDQEVYTEKYGWIEVAGYSYRTTYDLSRHIKYSKADLTYFKKYDKPIKKKIVKIVPNPKKIREIVGKDIGTVMKKLNEIPAEKILEELNKNNYVEISNYKLSRECFIISEKEETIHGEKIIPHVVEPSFGLERIFYVVLENSISIARDGRIVLKLPPRIAPYKVAVFPLVTGNKPEHKKMVSIARQVYRALLENNILAYYDEEGSIGRRYARADEIGIPYAITIDYQTLEDETVTLRDRDSREQIRLHIQELHDKLISLLGLKKEFNIEF